MTLGAAHAQVQVTFAVDMNGVSEFDPARDTLRVAGNFQTPNVWTPRERSNDNILTDPDGNGVYSVTYSVAPGATYQYKYVINIWDPEGANEASGTTPVQGDASCFINNDRTFTVGTTAPQLPIYRYNSCEVSTRPITSGVRDFAELRGVSVAPNPMESRARVALPAGGTYEVRVAGVDGRTVALARGVTGASYEIERADLAPGMYLVEVVEASRGQRAVLRLAVR